jgi:hypothetical protein
MNRDKQLNENMPVMDITESMSKDNSINKEKKERKNKKRNNRNPNKKRQQAKLLNSKGL